MKGHLYIDAESSTVMRVDYSMTDVNDIDPFLLFDTLLRIIPMCDEQREDVATMIYAGGIDKYFNISSPIKVSVDADNLEITLRDLREKRNEG